MELVVVNGANNIARSVIRGLTAQGAYRKVRLLDFRPYKTSVYAFQREMAAKGVEVEKHQANSGASLDIALEGADKVVYFTHNYTSMTSDKNSFLIGTAKLAKKHGVSSLTAVCPVEHDMAYTENLGKSWIQQRKEAEQEALAANPKLSILNTDLVFGKDPLYLVHYMAQCALAGRIQREFLLENANFRPVHHADVTRAVEYAIDHSLGKQLKVRGDEKISIKDFLRLIEHSCDKTPGATKALPKVPLLKLSEIVEELFVGITHDRNMRIMLQHFEDNELDCPCPGTDFWETSGLARKEKLSAFYQYHRYHDTDETMATPTFGHYKQVDLN